MSFMINFVTKKLQAGPFLSGHDGVCSISNTTAHGGIGIQHFVTPDFSEGSYTLAISLHK